MAVSIISNFTSAKFYPASNPINITVNSSNSGNCNFRYICDIYINGTRVFRDKLFPDPSTGYGFFQISRIVQDYMTYGIPATTLTTAGFSAIASAASPNTMLSVYVKIGEEYDSSSDCSGSVQQYLSLATSNTFYAFNGVIAYEDFPSWTYTDYLMGQGSWGATEYETKFLTNSPRTMDIGYDDSYYLNFYSTTAPTVTDIVIEVTTYYKDGSTNTWEIPAVATNNYRHYRVAVGPYNINKWAGTGPFPITQWIYKYDVKIINTAYGNPPAKSETFTFNLKVPTENKTRIGFIGLLGNTEYYNFFHRNKKSFDIERKSFKKVLQSNYSGSWTYQVGDRVDTTYAIKASEKHTVASYVNRDVPAWLQEMYMSPEVWVNKGPKVLCFHVYPETSTTTSGGSGQGDPTDRIGPVTSGTVRMLFWVGRDHGLEVGDQFYCYPDDNDSYIDYNNIFTVTNVYDDYVDCGVTYGIYNLATYVTGFLVKQENWVRLPVIVTDNTVEEKERVSKPIEYTLNYMMAYPKATLR